MTPIQLKIAIADPSPIIRAGLDGILKRFSGFRLTTLEADSLSQLKSVMKDVSIDILIINPTMINSEDGPDEDMTAVQRIALISCLMDSATLKEYDEQISIYDSPDEIRQKLEKLCASQNETSSEDEQQSLSAREKEIVVCVVKGMTNREIADQLYLSTHTVITHRRNIAKKLQIHSASGLTVYAIVNKLVELNDLKL